MIQHLHGIEAGVGFAAPERGKMRQIHAGKGYASRGAAVLCVCESTRAKGFSLGVLRLRREFDESFQFLGIEDFVVFLTPDFTTRKIGLYPLHEITEIRIHRQFVYRIPVEVFARRGCRGCGGKRTRAAASGRGFPP
jgi:hypothetical protein